MPRSKAPLRLIDPPERGPREERYLSCKRCKLSVTLNLAPHEERPQHRCQPVYKAMPFDIDLPASKAPKRPWFEDKPKHPRPRAGEDTRPRIVL